MPVLLNAAPVPFFFLSFLISKVLLTPFSITVYAQYYSALVSDMWHDDKKIMCLTEGSPRPDISWPHTESLQYYGLYFLCYHLHLCDCSLTTSL